MGYRAHCKCVNVRSGGCAPHVCYSHVVAHTCGAAMPVSYCPTYAPCTTVSSVSSEGSKGVLHGRARVYYRVARVYYMVGLSCIVPLSQSDDEPGEG